MDDKKEMIVLNLMMLSIVLAFIYVLYYKYNYRWDEQDRYSIIANICFLIIALTYGVRSIIELKEVLFN